MVWLVWYFSVSWVEMQLRHDLQSRDLECRLNSLKQVFHLVGLIFISHIAILGGNTTTRREIRRRKNTKVWTYMSKLGLPYLPRSLVWTKKVLLLSTLPSYPKSFDIFELKFVLKRIFSYFCKDTIG